LTAERYDNCSEQVWRLGLALITAFYIGLLLVGIVWMMYQILLHIRTERQDRLEDYASLSDEQFMAYLDSLQSQKRKT